MSVLGIDLFDLASRRLAWAEDRTAVLARNVANADTPGYQPRDVRDFAATLAKTLPVDGTLLRTNAGHLRGTQDDAVTTPIAPKQPTGHAPDGNAVHLDHELGKLADTQGAQSLALALRGKYAALIRTAIGRG